MGVYCQQSELELFFKRYDTNNDSKIRYLEFCDAFAPKDKLYASHLASKTSNFILHSHQEPLSMKTRFAFADTIRTMLKCESFTEELRQILKSSHYENFTMSGAFQAMDANHNGFLTKNEMREFMEKQEFFPTERELELLMKRMDRDRDGKVTYEEFYQEMAPK